jgi:hypothetical protein
MRLGSALLYGRLEERRTVNDNVKRIMGSLVVAAIACAVCVGVSFVVQLLADRAATPTSAPAVIGAAPDFTGAVVDGPIHWELP